MQERSPIVILGLNKNSLSPAVSESQDTKVQYLHTIYACYKNDVLEPSPNHLLLRVFREKESFNVNYLYRACIIVCVVDFTKENSEWWTEILQVNGTKIR